MRVEGPGGAKWESGANPELLPNAEYFPDPKKPGEGDLFLQPDRDLKGQTLKVRVLYTNDTIDAATVVAGKFDSEAASARAAPAAADRPGRHGPMARPGRSGPGRHRARASVHVSLSGLGRQPSVAGGRPDRLGPGHLGLPPRRPRPIVPVPQADVTGPLAVRPGPSGARSTSSSPRTATRRGATFTLRLPRADGRMAVARFAGGACDPGRRQPRRARRRVEAKPGDDLNALARQVGTVALSPGTYRLDRPAGPGAARDRSRRARAVDAALLPGARRPALDGRHQGPRRQHHARTASPSGSTARSAGTRRSATARR